MAKEQDFELLTIEGREVRITHPDKAYFSRGTKLSKIDLVRYYLSVAAGALGGIRDRPIVLKRFVNGAEGRGVLSEAGARRAAGLASHGDAVIPVGPDGGGDRRR